MSSAGAGVPVTVYWRPGCPYCAALRRRLRRLGVPTTEINIWSDPAAAGEVRRITGGDETVPTVVVDGTAMVNPGARQVLAAIRRAGPATATAAADVGPCRPAGASRSAAVLTARATAWAAVVASITVYALGHHGASRAFRTWRGDGC